MNDDNLLGGVLNQLGQTAKKTVQQAVKIPEEMAKDVGGQVGDVKQPAENKAQENKPQQQWQSDEERVKFLRDLYGKSGTPQEGNLISNQNTNQLDKKPTEFEEQIKDKSPEEQKKLMELRNQLHKENYYDPTFNRPQKQEERPAEKVENEKKQEMQDLQEKEEKKPPPLAVVREQNKTEMFRGASG